MKILFGRCLLAFVAPLAVVAAEQRAVKSEISAATVYSDRARVTRQPNSMS